MRNDWEPGEKPVVDWKHGDGPRLICMDGTPQKLTLWEQLGLRAGFLTLDMLDRQHNSEPSQA